ncbi:hypothetical protein EDD85DRAFT_913379 [Armillaria nabsnona]|nr:hypothetical protein EDD85DRAFT_913379 [Armillaria nabsnona]
MTYDYKQKYPEDAPYEEASPNARVWRTHEDESRNHDANMVEESRDNVDVPLVFAGLFSAVVTTFVPNCTAMSASLLYESVLVQRAIANGSSVDIISPSPLNPTIAFVPAIMDVWVNGLWFTSLFLSLTTAFVAVLVKQWLHHYVALPSGTPRDRSFTCQFRYAGFQKWHVQVIIGLLPVLMHLALAIFLSRAACRNRTVRFSVTVIRKTCRSRKQPTNHLYGTVYSCSVAVKSPYRRPYNVVIRHIVSDFWSYLEPLLEQAYRAKCRHATITQSWIYYFIALFHSLTVHARLAGSHELLSAFRTARATFL